MNVHPSGVIGEFLESRFSMSVLSPVAAVELFELEDTLASRDGGIGPDDSSSLAVNDCS